MTEFLIKTIGFREFLTRIFVSDSGVSSRRIGGFMSLISLLVAIFLKFPLEYCNVLLMLTAGFFTLTTASGIMQNNNAKPADNNIEEQAKG